MPGFAVVVGDVMTDVIVKPEGPLARGTDRRARIATLPGGSGANQAAWLGHFGVPVRFAARVGAGDVAASAASLRAFGVEPRLAADNHLPTGTLVTLLDPDGERSFLTDRGANDALGPGDLPESLLDGAALLHVSGYALFGEGPRAAVLALMAAARRRGLPGHGGPRLHRLFGGGGRRHLPRLDGGRDVVLPQRGGGHAPRGHGRPARTAALPRGGL